MSMILKTFLISTSIGFGFLLNTSEVFANRFAQNPAHAQIMDQLLCRQLLTESVTERELLAQFDTTTVKPEQIKKIPKSIHAFLVTAPNGRKYVLRLAGERSDPAREQFAIAVARMSPKTTTPLSRTLTIGEANALQKALFESLRGEFQTRHGYEAQFKKLVDPKRMSISVYLEAQSGTNLLKTLGTGEELREHIIQFAVQNLSSRHLDYLPMMESFKSKWDRASVQTKGTLIEDLEKIYPKMFLKEQESAQAIDVQKRAFYAIRLKLGEELSTESLRKLEFLAIQRLPQDLLSQLADNWALYVALNIPDYHSDQWLFRSTNVVAIDLAYPRLVAPVPFFDRPNMQYPFTLRTSSDPELHDLILQNTTIEQRKFIKKLSPQTFIDAALATGYPLDKAELDQIMLTVAELRARLPLP